MNQNWWQERTAYQIYPKSFMDTNGDGIGDLRGVINKLDYLQDLGIGLLWLSPIYVSPLADQGYDIADYYAIDPRFGTMEDLDELIAKANERDIKTVMDLVVNHCSDEHEWFQKACADPDGKYGKYFYIEDWDGEHLPCNWRSYFGGSCWEPLPGHPDKVYLHVFHKKQPDLNWENPEVRADIYKMINWWLDRGVSGFRIDAIINIKKLLPWQDFPADRDDGLCSIDRMLEQAKGVGVFLGEMRDKTFAPHQAFSVGEVFNEKPEELPEFIGEGGYFSSMFDFAATVCNQSDNGWYEWQPVTAEDYKACCFGSQKKVGSIGFLSNIIENHDEPRGVSRYLPEGEHSEAAKKMLGGLNFMLRGLPFLYQGQEIGMENTTFTSMEQVDDISTIDQYQVALNAGFTPEEALHIVAKISRDNARTPMQWTAGDNAGFTDGTPWLPVNPNYTALNVAEQMERDNSVYHFYRQLIALRKNPTYSASVVWGALEPFCAEQKNLMAYYRKGEGQTLLVLGNFQPQQQTVTLPGAVKELLNNGIAAAISGTELTMEGYQFLIFELV